MSRVLGLVGSGAGGVEDLLPRVTQPLQADGWTVAVTLTPTAGRWLDENGGRAEIKEAIGTLDLPVVVFPRVNAAHARHPSWETHIDALRRAGVRLVYGDDVWPLHEPRSAPGRYLPWSAVLSVVNAAVPPPG
ncbi:hypothetical protein [Amycolatopsis japonica]